MLTRGIKQEITEQLDATSAQIIARWIGCFGVLWNLKVQEQESNYQQYRNGLISVQSKPNQKVAHLLDESRPYLKEIPSQIRRNAASEWFKAMQAFLKGLRSSPKEKKHHNKKTCLVTNELFSVTQTDSGVSIALRTLPSRGPFVTLHIKVENLIELPKQIVLSRTGARFFISFSYKKRGEVIWREAERLAQFTALPESEQQHAVLGIDLGVKSPVVTSDALHLGFDDFETKRLAQKERRRILYQKKLSRQKQQSKKRQLKTGKNYAKTKDKLAKVSAKQRNIRHNVSHRISKRLAESHAQIIVAEDLNIKQMTKKAKPKQDELTGRYLPNHARAKSGLNRSILSVGWGKILSHLEYKLAERHKLLIRIDPKYSSQTCNKCLHCDKDNRISQSEFICLNCGFEENADVNAAIVLKNRFLDAHNKGTFVLKTKSVKKISLRGEKTARTAGLACGADVRPTPCELAVAEKQEFLKVLAH